MSPTEIVSAVRAFNRFYTQKIGVLTEGLLQSPFTLPEVRILWELAHRRDATATELSRQLGMDPGYTSRILHTLVRRRLVTRRRSLDDKRQSLLALTARGRSSFALLDARSSRQVSQMLDGVAAGDRLRLVGAMQTIATLLGDEPRREAAPYVIRGPRPGDLGWIVHRHGAVYAEEYGWDARFEALVADIVARFVAGYDRARERCFVAERDGVIAGSVLCVKKSARVAKLRLLLVEPSARGLGIGSRLVDECLRFAEVAGYRRVELWTQSVLTDARRLYERAGFKLVHEEAQQNFGKALVAQTFARDFTRR